jgi:hypothetical protein
MCIEEHDGIMSTPGIKSMPTFETVTNMGNWTRLLPEFHPA